MDNPEQTKRGRGRPGTYTNASERAKAWRQKQKDLIAQAQKPTEPVVVERVVEVERLVEKIVRIPVSSASTKGTLKQPDAEKLFPILRTRFNGFKGEENARRFRTNAARAATSARDIISLVQDCGAVVPEIEREFLQAAALFFDRLNGVFATAQVNAKAKKEKIEQEYKAKQEAEIKAKILDTFGTSPNPASVLAMAEDLLMFDKAAHDYLAAKYHVDKANVFIQRDYELRDAIRKQDALTAARHLAEVRIEIDERGRHWKRHDENCYAAGWQDFMEYRANELKNPPGQKLDSI